MVPEEILERATVDEVPPRYLRRQKPAVPKRRRLRQAGAAARRGAVILFVALAAVGTIGGISYLLFFSPETRLAPSQIEITGTHYVSSGEIAGVFSPDLGRSVFRVPLGKRLAAIEAMPWVRSAAVERLLPNRLNVSIVERQPVAFLNTNSGMELIDADGAILDLPSGARFNLPVVSGLDETVSAAGRARRLGMFSDFLKAIATVNPGADAEVSDVNLSNPDDVQATLAGLPVFAGQGPVAVHFGDGDYARRFRSFLNNFSTWQARAGNVEAVDLRYEGEALVTPQDPLAMGPATGAAAASPAAAAAAPTAPLSMLDAQTAAGIAPVSNPGKISKRGARQ